MTCPIYFHRSILKSNIFSAQRYWVKISSQLWFRCMPFKIFKLTPHTINSCTRARTHARTHTTYRCCPRAELKQGISPILRRSAKANRFLRLNLVCWHRCRWLTTLFCIFQRGCEQVTRVNRPLYVYNPLSRYVHHLVWSLEDIRERSN